MSQTLFGHLKYITVQSKHLQPLSKHYHHILPGTLQMAPPVWFTYNLSCTP